MWTLRRASISLRNRGYNVRASCVKLTPNTCAEDGAGFTEPTQITYGGFLSRSIFYHSGHASPKFTMSRCEFSSQADVSSTKEEDNLEDGFSELETPAGDGNENVLTSDADLSDDNEDLEEPHNEMELSDTETDDPTKKKSRRRRAESELFKHIVNAPGLSVHSALDKWVEEGKDISRQEVSLAMLNLRKHKMYGRALQLSEWLESKKVLEFVERDYASRVDLIAKLRGLQKAEKYIEIVPTSFRGEIIYRTLLAYCVGQNNRKKAEEIFNKMKDLGFPVTAFACNQLLLLYKRNDRKKIADVLLLMENENVKPTPFTYKILIDTKGQSRDIEGMDKIMETMKAEGIEPDLQTKAVLVRHYISAGVQEKAETILKEMEGEEDLKYKPWVCRFLLPLYAELGKADEVGRIWKACEYPRIDEYLAAIEALGKLKKIDEAEAVFEMMLKKSKLSSKNCSVLLKVYANNKMLSKGKDLVKRMADSGCRIGPLTWDALVKLYIQAGEVEKADSVLQKAIQQSQLKPLFSTYITILEQYAKKGDIHNAEKIFLKMKQAGYNSRLRQYQVLVQTYINAKLPAYGIRDRLKADNVFPNKALANQLAQVDGFRRSLVSDLLD